jgi:hypothetical protein
MENKKTKQKEVFVEPPVGSIMTNTSFSYIQDHSKLNLHPPQLRDHAKRFAEVLP